VSLRVFLADLRYNYSGVLANDCFPLGVAYMKAVMDREAPEFDSRIFVYPDPLYAALKDNPPDVLMLSNYVWNESLSFHFAKLAKQIHPEMLVVIGGPNISLEPDRQVEYLKKHPFVDLYVLGEGDFPAADVARNFLDADKSLKQFGDREIPSSVYRSSAGEVIRNDTRPRHMAVNDIPSPWLTGIQDEFFDGKLAPMIETNRGCPFSCTFCAQGTRWYTKVHYFETDRLREEINYIARRIRERSPNMGTLRIADSNYGMYERDTEISGYIGEVQKDFGWPTFIDATTGKNRPDRIIKSLEKVGGAMVLYQAVQSLDEDVLRNIKRKTIKLDTYQRLQVHMRGRGLRSYSDLILGLPGESLDTHRQALHQLLDTGVDSLHNFQAMMLKGAELETIESREKFGFQTRFRVLPKNFGVYGGERVFDTEEIIVATDTLSFEDYITARKYHLNSSVFWNDSWFEPVVRFVKALDIKPSEWWEAMLPGMDNGGPKVERFLEQFVSETKNELFPTPEDCVGFYNREENFRKLQEGEIGDNLMYKYRAIASFHIWPEICAVALDSTRKLLEERGIARKIDGFDEFWADLHRYVELKHAEGDSIDKVLAPRSATLSYHIESWLQSEDLTDISRYRLDEPTVFEFGLSEGSAEEIRSAFDVWGSELKGLSKLVTRIKTSSQVRFCRPQTALQEEVA